MTETVVALGAFALLFIGFGLLGRGRQQRPCDNCTCRDGRCVKDDTRHLELLE